MTFSPVTPVVDRPPHTLDYAPVTRQPFKLRSRHVAYFTGALAACSVLFVPDTVGSGGG